MESWKLTEGNIIRSDTDKNLAVHHHRGILGFKCFTVHGAVI